MNNIRGRLIKLEQKVAHIDFHNNDIVWEALGQMENKTEERLIKIEEKIRGLESSKFVDYNCCFRGQKGQCPCNRGCRPIYTCIFNSDMFCPSHYTRECLRCNECPIKANMGKYRQGNDYRSNLMNKIISGL